MMLSHVMKVVHEEGKNMYQMTPIQIVIMAPIILRKIPIFPQRPAERGKPEGVFSKVLRRTRQIRRVRVPQMAISSPTRKGVLS